MNLSNQNLKSIQVGDQHTCGVEKCSYVECFFLSDLLFVLFSFIRRCHVVVFFTEAYKVLTPLLFRVRASVVQ